MSAMKIKKGDTVKVIAGKDKGKEGKVLAVNVKDNTVIVEGINMVTKHNKPSAANQAGGITTKEAALHVSNVMLVVDGKGQKGIQRFIENVLLISETSADIRLDDTYIAPRDSQCLADDTADDMRDLCGSHYYDPALFHVSIGNWILDMTVLDDRGLIRSPDNCL